MWSLFHAILSTPYGRSIAIWSTLYGRIRRPYGWNHPGSTSLLAECHQTMLTLELLLVSIFHGIARVLLHLSNKR